MSTRRALLLVGRRLLGPSDSAAALEALAGTTVVHAREMSTRGRGRFRGARRPVGKAAPPPALEDPWEEVKDETTGQTYWWNVHTNETTALGEPKPLQRQQRNVLQHHHRDKEDDIFSSSSPPNMMFVHMGTIFLFGIGGSIGVTFIAALLGFR